MRLAGRGEVLHDAIDAALKDKVSIERAFGGNVFGTGKLERPNISPTTEAPDKTSGDLEEVFRWYVATIRKLKEILEPRLTDLLAE